MEAIAAIHGVYNKQNTSKQITESTDNEAVKPAGYNTCKVETTLSFAITPEIKEVTIRQSFNPRGVKINAIQRCHHKSCIMWKECICKKCIDWKFRTA